MMNGVMFGGEGPIMQGTWYNPKTKDIFTVKDSFFEDNNYVVMTTDGRCLSYNQIQNYIQTDTPVNELKAMFAKEKNEVKEEIPTEIRNILANDDSDDFNQYMIPEDDIYGGNKLGNINQKHIAPAALHKQPVYNDVPTSINKTIIEKGLKNTNGPKLTITVDWTDYPEKEISMLTGMMDIPHEEIADWYCGNLDTSWILTDVKKAIYNKIVPEKTDREKQIEAGVEVLNQIKKNTKAKSVKTKK